MNVDAGTPYQRGRHIYVSAPTPLVFPSEDFIPETKTHFELRLLLYEVVKNNWPQVIVGSGQFVYWDAGNPEQSLAPNLFVKKGAPDEMFDNWKIWERGAPDLAVEIVSAADQPDLDWDDKLVRYQASGIREVVRFDVDSNTPLRIFDRIDNAFAERSPESVTHNECEALGAFWIVIRAEKGRTLRLARDRGGRDLFPTPQEDRQRLVEELKEERRALAEARSRAKEAQARAEAARAHTAEPRARSLAELEAERDRLLAELALLKAQK